MLRAHVRRARKVISLREEKQLTSPQRSHAIVAAASSQRLLDHTLQLEAVRQTLGLGVECGAGFVEGVCEVPDKVLSYASDSISKTVLSVNAHIHPDLRSPT